MTLSKYALDELGTVSRGRSRHRPRDAAHLFGGPYPFIQTGEVKHAGLYLKDYEQTYSEAGLEQSKLWPEGTLCITIAANIADTSILKIPACFPDSIIGFIPDPKKSDARYIKYLFDAVFKKKFMAFTQGAAQDNLSQGKLLSLKFPIPDLNEQKAIADMLSTYDDLIENNRQRIELLEEAARKLYKEWFVRFRFPGHEHIKIIDGVPEGWNLGIISDFYQTSSGGTPSRKHREYYSGDINWVKTQELQSGFIFETDEKITEEAVSNSSAKLFPPRTVLVAMYGATIGQVGILSRSGCSNQACCALIPKSEGTNYIHATLFLFENKSGLVNLGQGAAQKNISQEIIQMYPMLMPPVSLMNLFTENLSTMFRQIENISMQIMQLTQARDLLLPKLMSGAIVV
jgi:type I restriction enzyme, S subunit